MVGREDPRVVRSRAAVVEAAKALLCEHGAAGVTMEGVAERAGVAKTTLYRLFPNRGRLLLATFDQIKPEPARGGPGELRTELVEVATALLDKLSSDVMSHALPALVDEAERSAELQELAREHATERRCHLVRRLAEAAASGELAAGFDADLEATRFLGPLFYRRFFARVDTTPAEAEALVDAFLAGFTTRDPGSASS